MTAHRGWILASPEYNSSVPGVLKNAIDWASRSGESSADLTPFRGRVVALLSASPSPLGGVRMLDHLRAILLNVGCWVLPEMVRLPKAADAFDDDGALRDPGARKRVERLGASVLEAARRMAAGS